MNTNFFRVPMTVQRKICKNLNNCREKEMTVELILESGAIIKGKIIKCVDNINQFFLNIKLEQVHKDTYDYFELDSRIDREPIRYNEILYYREVKIS